MSEIELALLCRALGDTTRLQIVQLLGSGEMCACRLLEHFSITQPTLSHHMKTLCECNLVQVRREGKWNHYSLQGETLQAFTAFVNSLQDKNKGENV